MIKNISIKSTYLIILLLSSCQTIFPDKATNINSKKLKMAHLEFAQKQLDKGKPELALRILRPLSFDSPDNASINNLLGITQLALNNPKSALKYFLKAYKKEKKASYGVNLSASFISLGRYKKARRILRFLLKRKDYLKQERLYHNLALSYERQNRYKIAVNYYKKALRENPSYYLSNLRLAETYKKLGLYASSRLAYKRTLASCSICYHAVHELAIDHIQRKHFQKALTIIDNFLKNENIPEPELMQAKKIRNIAYKKLKKSSIFRP